MATQETPEQPNRPDDVAYQDILQSERRELAERLAELVDGPLTALAFVMLALLIAEYTNWLPPTWATWSERIQLVIWGIFAAEFIVRLSIAPAKLDYIRRHWLSAISVMLPAFRSVRVLRAARIFRSVRLLRLVTTVNRSLREASTSLGGRTFPYFLIATLIVIVAGAAGIWSVEQEAANPRLTSFGDALWWAFALVAASELGERPATAEGRLVALGLAVYGMAVFGYITATLASFFVGSQSRAQATAAEDRARQLEAKVDTLLAEVAALRKAHAETDGPQTPTGP